MAATESARPRSEPLTRWIDLGSHADWIVHLHNYLLRLGFVVVQEEPSRLRVEADVVAEEFVDYVASWSSNNRVPVDVAPGRPAPPADTGEAQQRPRLGDLLLRKGFIREEQLTSALVEARAKNILVGIALLRDGVVFEDELARTLAEQLTIPYVSIMRIGVDPRAVEQLPVEVGLAAAAIPTRMRGGVMQVVFADPTDASALAQVRRYIPEFEVAVAEYSDITTAWAPFARGRTART